MHTLTFCKDLYNEVGLSFLLPGFEQALLFQLVSNQAVVVVDDLDLRDWVRRIVQLKQLGSLLHSIKSSLEIAGLARVLFLLCVAHLICDRIMSRPLCLEK